LEGRKYQKQIEQMVQLQNFLFFLIFMVVLGGTSSQDFLSMLAHSLARE
jgi:hypothetical protein